MFLLLTSRSLFSLSGFLLASPATANVAIGDFGRGDEVF